MDHNDRCILSGMKTLIDHQWLSNQAVVIEEGKIKGIITDDMIPNHMPAAHYQFAEDSYLVPGFIDLHIHGVKGSDVMDAEPGAFSIISKALAAEGVTGFLATTMTADDQAIEAVLKCMPEAMQSEDGAAILGVHLEGPFIAKEKTGAQCREKVRQPDLALIKKWQRLSGNAVKLVTLAPELPGALDFIRAVHSMGILVSAGHTNATYEETELAIQAGCSQATHLFNAMRAIHQREPGAASALLLSGDVTAELIVDGIHLHPAIVDLAYRIKGKEKLMLVTDAIRAKCMGDGQYDLGGQQVKVKQAVAMLADGTLAGSVLTMHQAIKNIVLFTQCELADAIYMASTNPARKLGIDTQKGSIAVGKDADIVILGAGLEVDFTMRGGREVFRG